MTLSFVEMGGRDQKPSVVLMRHGGIRIELQRMDKRILCLARVVVIPILYCCKSGMCIAERGIQRNGLIGGLLGQLCGLGNVKRRRDAVSIGEPGIGKR